MKPAILAHTSEQPVRLELRRPHDTMKEAPLTLLTLPRHCLNAPFPETLHTLWVLVPLLLEPDLHSLNICDSEISDPEIGEFLTYFASFCL